MRRHLAIALVAGLALVACRGQQDTASSRPVATFVHVSDPHLFRQRTLDSAGREPDSVARRLGELLDRRTLRAFLATTGTLPAAERTEFIVITGDWGIDTTIAPKRRAGGPNATLDATPNLAPNAAATAAAARLWTAQADTVAAILDASPVKQIYWVPGNNDIADERADAASLAVADQFTTLVSQRLRNGVVVQNLTACFAGQPSACTADVPNTRYTLLGVPTVSFKDRDTTTLAANRLLQDTLLARTDTLLQALAARQRRVLLATHVPEIDDPFTIGKQRFSGAAATRTTLRASTWNVSDSAFAHWKRLVESPTVAALLAGHLHDSHREIYESPYAWAESSPLRADPTKLLLVPPLSLKNQETSPIQARGFAVVQLFPDSVHRRLYWLDPIAERFVEETPLPNAAPGGSNASVGGIVRWAWHLPERPNDLARAAIWLFALLVAFLTVAALWRIPPPEPTGSSPTAATIAAQQAAGGSAFESNFARIILSGLGGIAAVTVLDSIWESAGFNAKAYYVVLFIAFLLALLLLLAILRGISEALRSRIALHQQFAQWQPPRSANPVGRTWSWLTFQGRRFWRWFVSLREALFVFLDTAVNYLAGRNQFVSEIWEKKLLDLQDTIVQAAQRIREEVSIATRDAIGRVNKQAVEQGIRVSITALSDDGKSVFYVAPAPGSLAKPFDTQSVAWVAIQSGQALWWTTEIPDETELYDNKDGALPTTRGPLRLQDYSQTRSRSDYQAYVVIPIPWRQRDTVSGRRRGAIHISFAHQHWFYSLWPTLTHADKPYGNAAKLLDAQMLKDDGLRASLHQAVDVLGELLAQFDQTIFERRSRRSTR